MQRSTRAHSSVRKGAAHSRGLEIGLQTYSRPGRQRFIPTHAKVCSVCARCLAHRIPCGWVLCWVLCQAPPVATFLYRPVQVIMSSEVSAICSKRFHGHEETAGFCSIGGHCKFCALQQRRGTSTSTASTAGPNRSLERRAASPLATAHCSQQR